MGLINGLFNDRRRAPAPYKGAPKGVHYEARETDSDFGSPGTVKRFADPHQARTWIMQNRGGAGAARRGFSLHRVDRRDGTETELDLFTDTHRRV